MTGTNMRYHCPTATLRLQFHRGFSFADAAALVALSSALRAAGMGLILDIVPNHMAADTANAWWSDVLRCGRASRFARWFDIDWDADDKVLLPILGGPPD